MLSLTDFDGKCLKQPNTSPQKSLHALEILL